MAAVLKPGTKIRDYKIVELAGDGSQSNVYLAEREGVFYWLIEIEEAGWEPNVRFGNFVHFDDGDKKWAVVRVNGTTVVNLASWVDKLELPFIGWQWATLAREIGFMHDKGAVLQATDPLALDRLDFNGQADLIVGQPEQGEPDQYTFPAPDKPGTIGPASDVYALGASLKALAGDHLPRGVDKVLTRATNPDPAKRYRNGREFSEALADVLPNPAREKAVVARPARSVWQWLVMAALLACGALTLCVGLVGALIYFQAPLPEPVENVVRPVPLRVTILNWRVIGVCDARVEVRVEDGKQVVTPADGLQFYATTPELTLNEVKVAAGANPDESVLTFPLGTFCKTGGALTVGARRDIRDGKSIVYYYPGDGEAPENAAGFKPGGSQLLIQRGGRGRLYFGLAGPNGGPADLRGAIKIRVYIDGIEAEETQLSGVNHATDPLVAVLVMDTSRSMLDHDAISQARAAAVSFIEKLHPNDYVCLYRFATTVSSAHICSTNHPVAIEDTKELGAEGDTALYDVLVEVGKRHADKVERQAIILLSDGADNRSHATREQALNDIVSANVPVYAIGLLNKDLAPELLKEIADRTGGEYLEAPTPGDLTQLYEKLRTRFENQYQVDFQSASPERTSGTLELIIDDGVNPISIKKEYQVQP